MRIDELIARLDGVKQTSSADRYVALCPAHDDRSPSLAVSLGDDGCILLHCFAGCETESVITSLGLTFGDLYPEPIGHHYKPVRRRFDARQVLAALDHESLVVSIIGADFLEHHEIDEPTWARLAQAVSRINTARADAAPLKVSK